MTAPNVHERCPKCHRPYPEHGDVILHCPRQAKEQHVLVAAERGLITPQQALEALRAD